MDGRGRWLDNVFIERLWRSLKYELIYPGDFEDGATLRPALDGYFDFYNHHRPHQALKYKTPADLYRNGRPGSKGSLDFGAPPQSPGFVAFGPEWTFCASPRSALAIQSNCLAGGRATQGCDPSAEPGPEWMAAPQPPPF